MSRVSDLRRLIATELAEVHTCVPGKIVSYDGRSAVVQPAISKDLASGESLAAPQIVNVPICWPCGDAGGGEALISVPLKAGDAVLLHFSERALENWLSGNDGSPGDPRMFDLSDAFATPVCRPGFQQADTQNLSVEYANASIKITPSGEVRIDAPRRIVASAGADLTVVAPSLSATGNAWADGNVGSGTGASGSFTTPDGSVVTVQDGLITNIY